MKKGKLPWSVIALNRTRYEELCNRVGEVIQTDDACEDFFVSYRAAVDGIGTGARAHYMRGHTVANAAPDLFTRKPKASRKKKAAAA